MRRTGGLTVVINRILAGAVTRLVLAFIAAAVVFELTLPGWTLSRTLDNNPVYSRDSSRDGRFAPLTPRRPSAVPQAS